MLKKDCKDISNAVSIKFEKPHNDESWLSEVYPRSDSNLHVLLTGRECSTPLQQQRRFIARNIHLLWANQHLYNGIRKFIFHK